MNFEKISRRARGAGRLAAAIGSIVCGVCGPLLSGCARPRPAAPAGFIQIDLPAAPSVLDPRLTADAISSRVSELAYQSLMRSDRAGNFSGALAASVERPTPTTLVFHLRRGARFSDGRPLTARDVKYTYDSILDPANRSIKRAGLAELSSIAIEDAYTVSMTTRRPYAPALAMATIGIVPWGSAIGRHGAAPPGSGPFRVVRFARDEVLLLARNRYHPAPARAVRGLALKIVPDPTVRALELAEGVCQFAENDALQPELLEYLAAQPHLRMIVAPGSNYHYLVFNFRDPRLRDLRVRRAIAYAIDRRAIVNSMIRGRARLASGVLPPEHWAYWGEVERYAYDPARARELLEEAGYDGRAHPLMLSYMTTPEGRRLAEALQAMLGRVGIRLEIHTNEWATFYGDLRSGSFDIAASQWVGVADPHIFYEIFDSHMTPAAGGNNRGSYANEAMDRLVEAGEVMLDERSRRAIYREVQRLAASDLPYVSLWWDDSVAAFDRRLEGFAPYPNGSLISFEGVSVAAAGRPQ